MGCRVLSFRGHKVTLLCFCHGKDNKDIAHLFIVERAALPEMKRDEPPVFAKWGGWMTATWTEHGRVYMIAVRGDREAVETYLPNV
jgi:hypothetical protein